MQTLDNSILFQIMLKNITNQGNKINFKIFIFFITYILKNASSIVIFTIQIHAHMCKL